MKKKFVVIAALLMVFGLMVFFQSPDGAYAWKSSTTTTGVALKWDVASMPVKYYVNPAGFPSSAVIDSAKAAFTTWNNAGSKASSQYAGTTTNNTITSNDQTNIVIWIGPDFTGDKSNIDLTDTTLAMCRYSFYSNNGEIVDADIYFNGINHTWATDGSPDKYDVQNVLTHEIGHFWGLSDLYDDASKNCPMYGYASAGEISKRILNADDIAGIRAIYGTSSSATPVPTTPTPTPTIPNSGSPSVAVFSNSTAFNPGEIVRLSASASGMGTVDVYVAVVFPDNRGFKCMKLDGSLTGFNVPTPLVSNWSIVPNTYDILSYPVDSSWPTGTYSWYVIFATPGSNPVDTKNWISYNYVNIDVWSGI
jgi:hypothetical protein